MDIDELLNALMVPDEFVELPGHQNLPLLFSIVGVLLNRWGGDCKVTEQELSAISGSHLKLFVNMKTKEAKVAVVDPNNPWTSVTPGVEPGHA